METSAKSGHNIKQVYIIIVINYYYYYYLLSLIIVIIIIIIFNLTEMRKEVYMSIFSTKCIIWTKHVQKELMIALF